MRPRIWLAVAATLLLAPAAGIASADPGTAGATTGAVTRVELAAPVEDAFLRVTDAAGQRLRARVDPADGHAVLVQGGPRGARLTMRALSRDGHVTVASVPSASPAHSRRDSILAMVGHGLVFAGLVGLLGLVALRFLVVGPAWRSGGPRPPGSAAEVDSWRSATAAALRRAAGAWWVGLTGAGAIAAAGLAIAPVALLRDLGGGTADLDTLALDTRWGCSWLVQVGGVAAAMLAAYALRRSRAAARPDPERWWGVALGAPAAAALVAISTASHASSGSDAAIGTGIDAVHLLATGCWFGGLLGLVLVVPAALRGLSAEDGTRLAAAVVVRFSGLAIVCVCVLAVTGVYRAIGELAAVGDLVHTAYGQALTVKLALFAILLTSGGFNRLVLHPRLERAALGLRESDGGAAGQLRVSVLAELVLAAVLIGAVAVLVSLPPP